MTTFSETYQYNASVSGRLHLMFLILSITETVIGVNAGSPSGQGFSTFLLQFYLYHSIQSQLSSCTISKKANGPILIKLSDGQAEGQTD